MTPSDTVLIYYRYEILRTDLVNIFYDATKDMKSIDYVFDETIRDIAHSSPSLKSRVTAGGRSGIR